MKYFVIEDLTDGHRSIAFPETALEHIRDLKQERHCFEVIKEATEEEVLEYKENLLGKRSTNARI